MALARRAVVGLRLWRSRQPMHSIRACVLARRLLPQRVSTQDGGFRLNRASLSGRHLIPESRSRVRLATRPAITVNVVVAGRVIPIGRAVALIV